ncbi:MAG: protein kinase family protein [Candidatus Nanopelagicales bacterium]
MDEQGAPNRQIGRFTLNDLVEERHGAQIWRAVDGTLNREVSLWLVPADDALVRDLEQSTRTAATVDDRRIVRILDMFAHDDLFVIVTEWCVAEVLGHHLTTAMPAAQAARIAFEVAGALESAHAKGIAHGLLRPSNVLICPDGEVRVTGLGIDAVLAGIEPAAGDDPVAADLNGIGSILYACLTARWPDGEVEDVPGAPQVGEHTPPPSRILADVPESLDDFCARTVLSIAAPKGRPPLVGTGQAREMLGASLTDLTVERRPLAGTAPGTSGTPARIAAGVGVLILVLGLGWGGWRLLSADSAAAPEPTVSTAPSASPSAKPSKAPETVTYRIVSGRDFDPLGNGEENPGRVEFAFDGDRNTAWRTVTYYNKSLDKPGVGLLLDLGAPRTIGAVLLDLVGNGTDLQVLTSNDAGTNPQDFDLMAQATEAGEEVRLKAADPTSARYVLVWMTGLPQVDGGWRGGIREVEVTN